MENKKTTPIIIIITIIILALIILIIMKNPNKDQNTLPSVTEIELNESMNKDTTVDINASLEGIDVADTTDEDLKAIDEELNNL